MTSITSPDGRQVDTRAPHQQATLGTVGIHRVDPRWDVTASADAHYTRLLIGPVTIHGVGEHPADRIAHLRAVLTAGLTALDDLTDEVAS